VIFRLGLAELPPQIEHENKNSVSARGRCDLLPISGQIINLAFRGPDPLPNSGQVISLVFGG